jgi:phage FluMu gp28-like protein
VLHWARQIGKSFTLAAWAVSRLVTVLSNSRENGAEFLLKCSEFCRMKGVRFETAEDAPGLAFEDTRLELRIRVGRKTGRIKVLAANPRTARGFSGDLILDEFAFHENSNAIWEAVEPILASNPDFVCRIASTGNGRHNMFYRMAAQFRVSSGELRMGEDGTRNTQYKVSRVTRTMAYGMGVPIYDPQSRQPITPEQARAQALDKRAYDQNYECAFADENATLLTHELISAAERNDAGEFCETNWSASALARFRNAVGPLYVGFDVGRSVDLSVISVVEKVAGMFLVRGILRMRDMRLPEQELRLGEICRLPKFQRAAIDMTGLGLGLFEYAEKAFGSSRIKGINFASTVPASRVIQAEGRKRETVRVTESLAVELLRVYEDRRIQHPCDGRLRDDLRKPEKVTSPGGKVSIAAVRDGAGHADHFWSLALAVEAGFGAGPFAYQRIELPRRPIF